MNPAALEDDHLGEVPLMNAFTVLFAPERAEEAALTGEFQVEGGVFQAQLESQELSVRPGRSGAVDLLRQVYLPL